MTMFAAFAALDATQVAARAVSDDPQRWVATSAALPVARPAAPASVRAVEAVADAVPYSWRALLGNPGAALMTGLVGTLLVADTVRDAVPFLRR